MWRPVEWLMLMMATMMVLFRLWQKDQSEHPQSKSRRIGQGGKKKREERKKDGDPP